METVTKVNKITPKRKSVFSTLLKRRKKIIASMADLKIELGEIDDEIENAIPNGVTRLELDDGIIELITKDGNVTWDQEKLIELIRDFAKEKKVLGIDVVETIARLEPRKSDCEKLKFDIESAKKVADAKIVLKITQ